MSPLHKYIKNKAGFSLVEVVVTMGLMIFLTASVTTVYVKTLRVYGFNQDRAQSTSRTTLGFQKMIDELQQSDGIKYCGLNVIQFSLAGSMYQYKILSNQLRRYDSANRIEIMASNIKTPSVGGSNTNAFTCSEGVVTIDIMSYNPAYSSSLTSNNAGRFIANVKPRGIPDHLVYWWKFDETTGAIPYDLGGRYAAGPTGNGMVGTKNGSTGGPSYTASGVDNGALSFTAANGDYVSTVKPLSNGELDTGQSYTVSFWVKPTTLPSSAGAYPGIFTAQTCSGISIASDKLFYNDGVQAPHSTNATISTGCWHHIAYALDDSNGDSQDGTMYVYLNGVLKDTFTSIYTADQSGCYYDTIGSDGNNYFNGIIDDVRFYDVLLSADEIAKLARYLPYYSSSTDATADILTDTNNCGAIGTVCSGGTPSCVNGKCCASGQMNCGRLCGTCKTASSDSSNCGSCGNACAGGKSCSNGFCCTTGLTNCFSTTANCVDLQSDDSNCGTCGIGCSGLGCTKGVCNGIPAGGIVDD